MSAALLWGDTARVERNRARLRQQPSPDFKTTSPEVVVLPIADRRPLEAEKSDRIELSSDYSKPITNAGVLAKCVKRVHELVAHRYPDGRVPAADAAGVFAVLAAIDAAAVRADASFVPDLGEWSSRNLRALKADAKAEIRAELEHHPVEVTGEFLGEQLGLLQAEQIALLFWDAAAIDGTPGARIERKRKADRDRRAAKRREAGVAPKGARFRELQALHPSRGKTTIYRWIAEEDAAAKAAKKARKMGAKNGK